MSEMNKDDQRIQDDQRRNHITMGKLKKGGHLTRSMRLLQGVTEKITRFAVVSSDRMRRRGRSALKRCTSCMRRDSRNSRSCSSSAAPAVQMQTISRSELVPAPVSPTLGHTWVASMGGGPEMRVKRNRRSWRPVFFEVGETAVLLDCNRCV